jgi:hypothetical protein
VQKRIHLAPPYSSIHSRDIDRGTGIRLNSGIGLTAGPTLHVTSFTPLFDDRGGELAIGTPKHALIAALAQLCRSSCMIRASHRL